MNSGVRALCLVVDAMSRGASEGGSVSVGIADGRRARFPGSWYASEVSRAAGGNEKKQDPSSEDARRRRCEKRIWVE